VAGTCERSNEPSGSIRRGEFLDWLKTFLVAPCINDIQHIIIQLMHTTWKRRVIKTH